MMWRALLILALAGGPVWAGGAPDAPAEQTASPACSSCDARKAGLKRLKQARDDQEDLSPPKQGAGG